MYFFDSSFFYRSKTDLFTSVAKSAANPPPGSGRYIGRQFAKIKPPHVFIDPQDHKLHHVHPWLGAPLSMSVHCSILPFVIVWSLFGNQLQQTFGTTDGLKLLKVLFICAFLFLWNKFRALLAILLSRVAMHPVLIIPNGWSDMISTVVQSGDTQSQTPNRIL